jgi:hypothetical protein
MRRRLYYGHMLSCLACWILWEMKWLLITGLEITTSVNELGWIEILNARMRTPTAAPLLCGSSVLLPLPTASVCWILYILALMFKDMLLNAWRKNVALHNSSLCRSAYRRPT